MSGSQDDLRPELQGLPLRIAQVTWVVVALVALAIIFFSLPALLAQFTTDCRGAAGVLMAISIAILSRVRLSPMSVRMTG